MGDWAMLIEFTLRNWRCFAEEAALSMLPSRERRYAWTMPRFATAPKRLLPVAFIHGANGSGKSAVLEGLRCLTHLVLHGCEDDGRIPVAPCLLDPQKRREPVHFSILFRTSEHVCKYELALTGRDVVEERLVLFLSKGERELFVRKGDTLQLDQSVETASVHRVFAGTHQACPFLTEAGRKGLAFAADPCAWFRETLVFIGAGDSSGARSGERTAWANTVRCRKELARYLAFLDTGIRELVAGQAGEDRACLAQACRHGRESGRGELCARHRDALGNEMLLDLTRESSGTQRLLDVLQILVQPRLDSSRSHVYVLDEIDRSLHPNLLCQLVTEFLLQSSAASRTQLVATAQSTVLMEEGLVRRDEVWLADKGHAGSVLCSVSDFRLPAGRTCHDLQRLARWYREGRLGGVPRLVRPLLPLYRKPEK